MAKPRKAANGHTVEHLQANLEKANAVRARKRQFREDMGKLEPAEALRQLADRLVNDPDAVRAVKVEQMLLAVRGVGKSRAKLLARSAANTSLTDRVDRLPEFRRRALAQVLLDRAGEVERRVAA